MKFTVKHLSLVATLIVVMLILSSCTSLTGSGAIDKAYCTQFRPISWSTRDTDETIGEVKAHNAVGVALCGWRPE